MSHPLGPLAHNMTAYAIYATAQAEMRRAYALIDAGNYLGAAEEIDSAARAAEVLVIASEGVDEGRAEHWRRVVHARRRFAERARGRGRGTRVPGGGVCGSPPTARGRGR
ncbi:hypothetical protein [Actinophytocola xanthii]|uniref:HEPN domain-containing protein n=1 Tax=Actinophytocola xanthii TaxID=1912961 RepID=A0A1Q8CWB4_9PSEU|nr:hypothetical protein [Actinophytocola xanthii]OLF18654.1 hypothetical protein BU204_05170 [Actinophytocola xanthii]